MLIDRILLSELEEKNKAALITFVQCILFQHHRDALYYEVNDALMEVTSVILTFVNIYRK